MICEIAWAPRRLHLTNWTEHLRIRDNRGMLQHLLSGRPTILVTGHYGNFEVCGYAVGLMGFPTLTIARRLDNAYLHEFLEDFRGTHGQFMVDKEGCAPTIERHLAKNGRCRCWPINMLVTKVAGSSFSVLRRVVTKRSHCSASAVEPR